MMKNIRHVLPILIGMFCCLCGLHNWWDAGGGEQVCIDCGHVRRIAS